ncbi:MAG TPA: glycosyltransferase family 4 protein [Bacteroidales bacterium]|nr:glycosyltransferase family 4 protein [Bacteroidales bacterium]
MKVVQIIPGSGGSFYCGNCMRDSKYIEAIRAQGLEVIIIPMYLPLIPREKNKDDIPVFYGAISIYLKQLFPIFRKAPVWVERLLNSKPMLKFAAGMANSTRSNGLEDMTISMLLGEHGAQREELEKMVDWLQNHYKADVIHLSNALLLGLTHLLKERLNIPVVCSLQDEDVWVDGMDETFKEKTWNLLKEKATEVDRFISVSHYFTSFMKGRLNLPDEKITTLHLGVDPADYVYKNAAEKGKNIGYLSRLCEENGLDILIDAFILLKGMPGNHAGHLLLTGGHTGDDTHFIAEQKRKINQAGLADQVQFIHDFSPEKRNAFFDQVTLLSVPVRHGEAFGIYLAEAMAAGIPVVQPALGAFPEIVRSSGGGVIYQENTPLDLAETLKELLSDSDKLASLSFQARKSIEKTFNIHALSKEMASIYEQTITNKKQHPDEHFR